MKVKVLDRFDNVPNENVVVVVVAPAVNLQFAVPKFHLIKRKWTISP